MKIVTSEQMRQIEARSTTAGVSTDALMENAGLAVAKRVRSHLGHLLGVPTVVLVGPGNNGGDGLVAARHLHNWGAGVTVCLSQRRREPDPKAALARELGIPFVEVAQDMELGRLKGLLAAAHVVLDCVLGTGRARPIEGTLKAILGELAEAKARRRDLLVMALDLPTGLDADTGNADPACPFVDVTLTLGYPKVGLFAFPGAERVGLLETLDIGIPAGLDHDVGAALMTREWARARLPARAPAAHKGTFGRTLVVAGSRDYIGAAYLAATGAYRAGAGLVTLAIPRSLQVAVAAKASEPTYIPLPESSHGVVSSEAASRIIESLAGYDALLIGCGLGQAPSTKDMVERLLFAGTALPPTVVDADGLNILSKTPGWWERFSCEAVVTPHPGEMARLIGNPSGESPRENRIERALRSAAEWNKVTVLKGAHTVVALADASAMVSPFVNPGLASAGTGDVLAGTIAALLAQGLTLGDAAALGVYLHGAAGERVRESLGDTGMMAGDLLDALPRVIRDLRNPSY